MESRNRLFQFCLSSFAFADILRNAKRAYDFSLLIEQGHLGCDNPSIRSVWPSLIFFLAQRLSGTHDLLLIFISLAGMLSSEKVKVCLAYHLRGITQTKCFGMRLGCPNKTASSIFEVDVIRGGS